MDMKPRCLGRHVLFDSTYPAAHREAAAICATCPLIAQCRNDLAEARRDQRIVGAANGPTGTWAGMLVGRPEKWASS